jgi:hypothetical protein
MRLHLAAEDVSLALVDQAGRAAQRIPGAVRELLRIKDDAAAVRASAAATLRQLEGAGGGGEGGGGAAAAAAAPAAVAALEEIDAVKRRMEAACSTLKEAAGLSSLFHLVDDLFASGDLRRVGDALAGMRRGLAVVGDSVPEFRDGPRRLAALEDRLAAAAEGPLAAALARQRGDEAAVLAGALAAAGRGAAVARLYAAARAPPLQALWDGYAPGTPFVPWLSTFYDQLVRTAAAECAWCAAALPQHYPALVLGLLGSFLEGVDKPHRARLAGALTGASGSVLPLEHLEQAAAAAADFGEALRAALGSAGALGGEGGEGAFLGLYAQAAAPLEGALAQYPEKELQYLSAELQGLAGRAARAGAAAPEALAPALAAAVEPAFAAADAALARCLKLTEGSALPAMARALDRALQQYVSALQAPVAALRGRVAFQEGGGGGGQQAAEAVLPLLLLAEALTQRLAAFEAAVRAAAADAVPPLLAAAADTAAGAPGPAVPSAAAMRMRAQPALAAQLAAFLAAPASPLPTAAAGAAELSLLIGGFAEDVLLLRLRAQLAAVPALPEWSARPSSSLALPSFAPYPLHYVTSAGEYLMLLPQLLESALAGEGEGGGGEEGGGEGGGEGGRLAAEWIDRAAGAAAAAYLEQLPRIAGLSPQGAAQLAADLEYFTNVLSTLGVGVPPALAAWQAAAAAPDAAAARGVAEAAAAGGGAEEARAVAVVAKLRGLSLAPPPAGQ